MGDHDKTKEQLIDELGELRRRVAVFECGDIQRKQAEEEARQSEDRFRALTAATSDAVYCMSPDWTEMRHLQGRDFIADTLEPSCSWQREVTVLTSTMSTWCPPSPDYGRGENDALPR